MSQPDDEKVKDILAAIKKHIFSLQEAKKCGTYQMGLELHLSQGGIGDAFLNTNARERILK
jgi:hypothetical protein